MLYKKRLLILFIPAVVLMVHSIAAQQQTSPQIEYYRNEATFRQGIKLFPFEVHEGDYLKVVYNDLGLVRLMSWYSREDVLLKTRSYEYWQDDGSVKRLLELTPDSLLIREVLFGDEPKSQEFIEYVYGVEFVPDFRNRFTEIRADSSQRTASYKIMSIQGELLGSVFLDYDSLGFLTNETWFQGAAMRRVREFRYIFHRDTGEQEVVERGPDGQVVSHVRIRKDPHKISGWSLGMDVEGVLDTVATEPQVVPADSTSGGEP